MRLKFFIVALISLLSLQTAIFAQPKKKSYNFTRAIEEAKENNNVLALEFLSKEIQDNPKNGYAYMCKAVLHGEEEQYEEAMEAANMAIKKLPKKGKNYLSAAYLIRAKLFELAGDTVRATTDFEQAFKLNPDNTDLLEAYGQFLYERDRYEEANEIYSRMIHLNPAGVIGYMGLGRNAHENGNYDEAIKQYNAALRLHDDYALAYSFRGESYLKQRKYIEATDDFIKALSTDNNSKAHYYITHFPSEQTKLVVTKLKGMAAKNPHEAEWWCYIGQLYQNQKQYAECIEAMKKAYDIDAYFGFMETITECYQSLGQYDAALATINELLQQDPDDSDWIMIKANVLGDSGDHEGAIEGFSKVIERLPDQFTSYYNRGFHESKIGRIDDAIEDFDMAIMLCPTHTLSHLGRADMLQQKGQTEEAEAAYRKVLELDTIAGEASAFSMYAYLGIGEPEKAKDIITRAIEADSTMCENYYDAACLYSRLGDTDKSLNNLCLALKHGFRKFAHLRNDADLAVLREHPEFGVLMAEYEHVNAKETRPAADVEEGTAINGRVEIPFTPEGGCFAVKCSINELPLNFVFDTGASTVSISQVEATFMLKNGYLKRNDIVGSERYVDANGDVSEGTLINLREVDFGGMKLKNVRASAVRNQKAPLLLGQTVLGRLGSIEIDNPGKKLIITNSK